ncbi:MAG: helix-turn-helix transcriptional regulator [Verrucomicrobiales bacterium]|nr:helix-turn-helix transcriptional regulator [Verrucomicrobiales bacterium]
MIADPSTPIPSRHWFQWPADRVRDWREAVAGNAVNVWLNFGGEAEVEWKSGERHLIQPGMMQWLRGNPAELRLARRLPSRGNHECLALQFPQPWIERTLQNTRTGLSEDLKDLLHAKISRVRAAVRTLAPEDRVWAQSFMAPHLCEPARQLLDKARLTEFFVRQLFDRPAEPKTYATRTRRLARERVDRVKAALCARLDDPPPLDALAVLAGCNQHYLSRTFTQVEGITLSLWLRRARIEKAAGLIASGTCNVSEAALEVGYRSFSHFSRAFFEEKGVQPSRWVLHLQKG